MAEIKSCEATLNSLDNHFIEDIESFNIDVKQAVANFIGHPNNSKLGIRIALKNLKNAKTNFEKNKAKRELRIAESLYKSHLELYQRLSIAAIQKGEALNYDLEPSTVMDDWRVYFSKKQRGYVSDLTIQQNPRAAKSMLTSVKIIEEKRAKLKKSGKLNKREVALFPPEVVAIRADKFGVAMKVIRKGLRLSDNEISSYEGFANKIRRTLEDYKDNLTDNQLMQSVLNLNDAAAWGIEGFNLRIDAPKTGNESLDTQYRTGPNAKVVLVGEGVIDDQPIYKIKYYRHDGSIDDKIFNIHKEHLNASQFDVKKALVGFYVGNFMNETLDGRVRNIKFGYIPPSEYPDMELGKMIPNESEEYLEFKDKYKDRLSLLIQEMKDDYEYGQTEEGEDKRRQTPNVYFVRGKDGTQYRYALLKDTNSETGEESYTAFLLNNEPYKNDNPELARNFIDEGYEIKDGVDEWDNIRRTDEHTDGLLEGWHRASEEKYYGRLRKEGSKDNEMIEGSARKAWRNFEYIENQPANEIINENLQSADKTLPNFWKTLAMMRAEYRNIGEDAKNFHQKNLKKISDFTNKIEARMDKLGLTSEQKQEFMDNVFSIGGMRSKVYYTPPKVVDGKVISDGYISTPNSYFSLKKDNYLPHIFEWNDLNTQIDNAIDRVETAIDGFGIIVEEDIEKLSDVRKKEYENLQEGLKHLQDMADRNAGNISDEDKAGLTRMTNAQANPNMKHITDWTDATLIRTDSNIHADYLKQIYSSLHKNDLMADVVEAVDKLMQMEKNQMVPEGVVDYLINRIKMTVGDSDTRSTSFITGKEGGYSNVAENLNNLPTWIKGGVEHTSDSAERLIKWVNAIPSMRFLDSSSAAMNLTQISNQVIANGFTTLFEAGSALNGKYTREKWESIVEGTGVLNLLTMLNDIMLQGGQPGTFDWGFDPITGLIPGKNMRDFVKLVALGRENFIMNNDDQIDLFLLNLESRSKGELKDKVTLLKELRQNKEETKNILKRKRAEYYDAITIEKTENKQKLIEARFQKLIGDIQDHKIRTMVTWKLSWHWDPLKSVFTFTGTEETLRKHTAVMALLDAEKRGELGGNEATGSKGDMSIFKTAKARKIARDAVYNTQFGMSPQYVGEAFNGLGRAIYQYKTYAVQQMEHDWNIVSKFWNGGYSTSDNILRLVTEATKSMTDMGVNFSRYPINKGKGVEYNPTNRNIDHDARAVLRFVFTRATASVLATLVSVIPAGGFIMDKFGYQSFSMLRSFENPAVGIAMRTATWAVLMGMGSDEDDKMLEDIFGEFSFLLMPVIIGMLGRGIYNIAEDLN